MTNRTSRPLVSLVLLAAGAGLVPAALAGGDPTAKPTARTAAAGWVAAPAAKHNGSGIRLGYRVPAGLQPGQATTVQLQFSAATADDARAEWRMSGTAGALAPSAASSVALTRGQPTTVSVAVTPAADGMAYLDVFTTQGGRTSAQSVPLKVGSGAVVLKRQGVAQTMPSGEKVISLPSSPK